jgi:hypothetical protein
MKVLGHRHRNTETLTDASREAGLEVNTENTMHMLLSRHQNAGQNHDIKTANRFFENLAQFRSSYFGTTITNQNLIQKKIKRRLNLGSACCYSFQKIMSSCLLLKDVKIRINKTITLPVVPYGWDEVTGGWRKLHNE